jgi:hypothetical protein
MFLEHNGCLDTGQIILTGDKNNNFMLIFKMLARYVCNYCVEVVAFVAQPVLTQTVAILPC